MKKMLFALAMLPLLALAGCEDSATVASQNIRKAGDNFEIQRRVVFYNGITNEYVLEIVGRCSFDLSTDGQAFSTICKDDKNQFRRHTLVRSDNVTAFVEQLDAASVSTNFYRVTFKPTVIIPDIRLSID